MTLHLLLNLAEDLNIEVKMVKRDIVKYLIEIMDRATPELVSLVLKFLKKLSVFQENKDIIVNVLVQHSVQSHKYRPVKDLQIK